MRVRLFTTAAMVACLLVSVPARADMFIPPFNMYPTIGAQMLQPQIDAQRARAAAEIDGDAASNDVPVPASSVRLLAFTPTMARRQANYARFVAQSRRVDPAGAAGLAETLSSDPIAAMGPELARFGLRADNVADAYTVYWVEAWQAAHGVVGDTSTSTAQAVRNQAAAALLAAPEFRNAGNAQKQEFADALLVQALLIGAARHQANGDAAQLRQIAAAVRKGAQATGLNLDAMVLTGDGFAPAKGSSSGR